MVDDVPVHYNDSDLEVFKGLNAFCNFHFQQDHFFLTGHSSFGTRSIILKKGKNLIPRPKYINNINNIRTYDTEERLVSTFQAPEKPELSSTYQVKLGNISPIITICSNNKEMLDLYLLLYNMIN
jgi:hypothetical protein